MIELPLEGRLGVVFLKAIGDYSMYVPFAHVLREARPDAHITLIGQDKYAPLAKHLVGKVIDDLVVWDRSRKEGLREVRAELLEKGKSVFWKD